VPTPHPHEVVPLPGGRWFPDQIAVAGGAIWVPDFAGGTIAAIDSRSGHLVADHPVRIGRAGPALSDGRFWVDGDAVWVKEFDRMLRFDLTTRKVVWEIAGRNAPGRMIAAPDGLWNGPASLSIAS
jgi:hypothetical protein